MPGSAPPRPQHECSLHVFVVESPSPADLYDGRSEGRVLSDMLALAGISWSYKLAVNDGSFRRALNELAAHRRRRTEIPVLHLSCHGTPDGISLTSREQVSWRDLGNALRPAHDALGFLILCMSSCGGLKAQDMVSFFSPQPFSLLVGHPCQAAWTDCAVGFMTLYHLLSKGVQFSEALTGMQVASGDPRFNATAPEVVLWEKQSLIDAAIHRRRPQNEQGDG